MKQPQYSRHLIDEAADHEDCVSRSRAMPRLTTIPMRVRDARAPNCARDRVCSAFQLGVALQPGGDFDDDSIAFFSCPSQLLLAASNLFASWSSFIARFLCLSGSAIFVMPASMLAIE